MIGTDSLVDATDTRDWFDDIIVESVDRTIEESALISFKRFVWERVITVIPLLTILTWLHSRLIQKLDNTRKIKEMTK
jgi:hypothetical protein